MGIAERKEREKEFRRQSIIDAAEKVFFSKGFDQSTMDDIAIEAELSKGTLYLYFRSKDELHFAIMERGMGLLMQLMEEKLKGNKNGRETLRELGLALVAFSNLYPDYFNSLIVFQASNLEQQKINERKLKQFMENRNSLTLLNETIVRGMEDGSIRKDIPLNELSTTLWAQMMGILVMFQSKKMAFDLHGVSREMLVNTHLNLIRDSLNPNNMEETDHV
jgi:AcrR family transcriptional regulator